MEQTGVVIAKISQNCLNIDMSHFEAKMCNAFMHKKFLEGKDRLYCKFCEDFPDCITTFYTFTLSEQEMDKDIFCGKPIS